MKIAHPNCSWHNWILYSRTEKDLSRVTGKISGRLYDLGCGQAPYKEYFLNYCAEYIGVDWTTSADGQYSNIIADLNYPLPIESAVADCAIAISVLEHLSHPTQLLSEVARILKPNGKLILQVPWQWWIHEEPHDYYRFSPWALNLLLQNAGFTNIEITAQSGAATTIFIKVNYLLRRFVRGPTYVKKLVELILIPIWTINQFLAIFLDRFDSNWDRDTTGYFVTAELSQKND